MLYDPKWEKVWTTEGLLAWLEQQPKNARYDYTEPGDCAVAQYLQAHGVPRFDSMVEVSRLKVLGWDRIVNDGHRYETFGGAARRARHALGLDWRGRIMKFFHLR